MTYDLMTINTSIQSSIKQLGIKTPPLYSVENALSAAKLILEQTTDKNHKSVLESCNESSIHAALLQMITQGLDPLKEQCYFVAYGGTLKLQVSYFGIQQVAANVDKNINKINALCIYKGDKLLIEAVNGERVVKEHFPAFDNINKDNIIGAYAVAINHQNEPIATDLMTFDDIKQSWKQSKSRPVTESGKVRPDSVHGKFPEEMSKRTVIRRLCKKIIQTSNDKNLLEAVDQSEEKDLIQEEIQEFANTKQIDFEPEEVIQMASREQAEKIYRLAEKLNFKDEVLLKTSLIVDRPIDKLSQLTYDEAGDLIEAFESDLETVVEEKPFEGITDEPPWKP